MRKKDESAEKPEPTRVEILSQSLKGREQEIMHYQLNIDNYTLALEEIGNLSADERAELSGFTEQLNSLLLSEKLEQRKSKIMLKVIQRQFG